MPIFKTIAKSLVKNLSKTPSDKVKVYRGELAKEFQKKNFTREDYYKENPFYESMDMESMGSRFNEINQKREIAKGRWFSTNEGSARSYADDDKSRLLVAEISKRDLSIGKKMNRKFFNEVEASDNPQTLLLPRKNLKDVKEDIDFYKDKVGTIASTEYNKGGLIKGYPKLAQRGWK